MNKKLQKLIMLLIAFTVIQAKAQQVTVTSTAGSGSGSTGGYSTLNGAFTDINNGVYQGDIDIRINASFSLSSSAVLNASGTGSASYSSILIRPADTATVNKQVSTTTSNIYMIDFSGADNVTIDGRAGGTGTTSILELLYNVVTTGTTANTGSCLRLNDGATNNQFRYLKVTNMAPQSTGTAVGTVAAGSTGLFFMNTTTSTPPNSNNTIDKCTFVGGRNCVLFNGTNASASMDNIVIKNSSFSDFGNAGVFIFNFVDNFTIDSNNFFHSSTFSSSNGQSTRAITIAGTTNRIRATVTRNRIYDLKSSGFSGVSMYGIILTAPSGQGNTVNMSNNSICHLQTNAGVSATMAGIILQGSPNAMDAKVYNNTIRIGGAIQQSINTAAAGTRSYCFIWNTSAVTASLDHKNNVYINTRSGLTSTGGTCYYLGAYFNFNNNLTFDYDVYYGTPYTIVWGGFIWPGALFQGSTGTQGQNCIIGSASNPVFSSTQQPYLTGASLGDITLAAPVITAVPTDIDNTTRGVVSSGYTYRGAHEPSTAFLTNDLAATIIYTYGKIPVGTLDSIRFRIKNNGIATLTNKTLTINITGANPTTLTYTIPSIAGLADKTYTFPGYTPLNLGYDTITASVPSGDQNTANDVATWVRLNTLNSLTYTTQGVGRTGNVGNNGQGEIIAKFSTPVNNFINQVNVDFTNAGFSPQSFAIVIYEDSGSTWGPKLNPLYVSATQTTVNGVFNMSIPSVAIRSGYFYVGVRQTTANNIGFAYQNETPIRTGTFYFRQATTFTTSLTWNDFAPNNPFKFMIEPRLKINNDLGVTDLVSPSLCAGSAATTYSVNVQNLGLLTQDFSVNPLSVYGTATDPNGTTTAFGPITINSDTLTSDGNLVVTLTNSYNMSTPGSYTFKAWTYSAVDINTINDTLPSVVRTAVTPVTAPYKENFNASTALPSGWSTANFKFNGNAGTGVSGSNSMRALILSTSAFNANAYLSSPRITGATAASQLRFKYKVTNYIGGAPTALLSVDSIKVLISSDCGTTYNYAYVITGANHTTTSNYTDVSVNLAGYVGGGNDLLVKFQLDWWGTSNNSYVDFDDIRFIDTTNDVAPLLSQAICSQIPLGAAYAPTAYFTNIGANTANNVSYGISITGPGVYSNSGSSTSISSMTAVQGTYSFTPSVVGTYNVKIYNNYSGDNDIYNDTMYTTFTVFAGVSSITVSNLATDSFTVNWTAVSGATSYNLDVATDAAFNSILTGYNNLSVSGTSQNVSGLTSGVKYYFRIRTSNTCGTSGNSATDSATTLTLSTPLTLTAYLQGLYLGAGTMIASPFAADGVSPTNIADTITIELHNATSPYALVSSTVGTIGTNGVGNISLPAVASGGTYYIVLKHRNSITTWSANPVTLNNVSNSYNFSTAATQAYGDNMVDDGTGKFMIYSGDLNQDGSVDFNDYPDLDVASSNGVIGYDPNDLNGDASVDFNDYPLLDVNSSLGVIMVTP